MSALRKRNVLAGSVRRIVRRMAVIGGHGMPESSPGIGDAVADQSV